MHGGEDEETAGDAAKREGDSLKAASDARLECWRLYAGPLACDQDEPGDTDEQGELRADEDQGEAEHEETGLLAEGESLPAGQGKDNDGEEENETEHHAGLHTVFKPADRGGADNDADQEKHEEAGETSRRGNEPERYRDQGT